MSETTYLYDNIEVKTTGRIAKKKVRSRRHVQESDEKEKVLHEITPVDNELGTWKRWIDLNELFVIEGDCDK